MVRDGPEPACVPPLRFRAYSGLVLGVVLAACVGFMLMLFSVSLKRARAWVDRHYLTRMKGHYAPGGLPDEWARVLFDKHVRQVTLIMTDVEQSTALWEWDPVTMNEAIARHDQLMRNSLLRFCGYEVTTEGDAFIMVFHGAEDALQFAMHVQSALMSVSWPTPLLSNTITPTVHDASGSPLFVGLRVRMAMETGSCTSRLVDPLTGRFSWEGPFLHVTEKLADLGDGGQVVLGQQCFKMYQNSCSAAHRLVQSTIAQYAQHYRGIEDPVDWKAVIDNSRLRMLTRSTTREHQARELAAAKEGDTQNEPRHATLAEPQLLSLPFLELIRRMYNSSDPILVHMGDFRARLNHLDPQVTTSVYQAIPPRLAKRLFYVKPSFPAFGEAVVPSFLEVPLVSPLSIGVDEQLFGQRARSSDTRHGPPQGCSERCAMVLLAWPESLRMVGAAADAVRDVVACCVQLCAVPYSGVLCERFEDKRVLIFSKVVDATAFATSLQHVLNALDWHAGSAQVTDLYRGTGLLRGPGLRAVVEVVPVRRVLLSPASGRPAIPGPHMHTLCALALEAVPGQVLTTDTCFQALRNELHTCTEAEYKRIMTRHIRASYRLSDQDLRERCSSNASVLWQSMHSQINTKARPEVSQGTKAAPSLWLLDPGTRDGAFQTLTVPLNAVSMLADRAAYLPHQKLPSIRGSNHGLRGSDSAAMAPMRTSEAEPRAFKRSSALEASASPLQPTCVRSGSGRAREARSSASLRALKSRGFEEAAMDRPSVTLPSPPDDDGSVGRGSIQVAFAEPVQPASHEKSVLPVRINNDWLSAHPVFPAPLARRPEAQPDPRASISASSSFLTPARRKTPPEPIAEGAEDDLGSRGMHRSGTSARTRGVFFEATVRNRDVLYDAAIDRLPETSSGIFETAAASATPTASDAAQFNRAHRSGFKRSPSSTLLFGGLNVLSNLRKGSLEGSLKKGSSRLRSRSIEGEGARAYNSPRRPSMRSPMQVRGTSSGNCVELSERGVSTPAPRASLVHEPVALKWVETSTGYALKAMLPHISSMLTSDYQAEGVYKPTPTAASAHIEPSTAKKEEESDVEQPQPCILSAAQDHMLREPLINHSLMAFFIKGAYKVQLTDHTFLVHALYQGRDVHQVQLDREWSQMTKSTLVQKVYDTAAHLEMLVYLPYCNMSSTLESMQAALDAHF